MDNDIEDIHDGQVHQLDDQPLQWGLIFGVLALLFTLVILALTGVIYHRDKRSIPLCHLIIAIIAVLAAALCAAVFTMVKKARQQNLSENPTLVAIALLAALIFFGYFLASSVYIFMYRPFHYSKLI